MSICVPQFGAQDGEGCSLPPEIHIYAFVVHIYLQSDVSLCAQRSSARFMTSVNGAGSGGGDDTGMVTLTRVTAAKRMWEGEHAQI